ncbi:MAG: preprotein translocase subunit SecG [Betaproteobacteria bacterium]|nr:preprotein translocase subunit SecG [Betaproteobacteria bacterium]
MLGVVLSIHVLVAIAIVVLVLLQHGKGADMGAAFGSGSAGSLFGAAGASNFLSKATGVCATVFFITCLVLTYIHTPKQGSNVMGGGVMQNMPAKTDSTKPDANAIPAPAAPAVPAPAEAEKKGAAPKQ